MEVLRVQQTGAPGRVSLAASKGGRAKLQLRRTLEDVVRKKPLQAYVLESGAFPSKGGRADLQCDEDVRDVSGTAGLFSGEVEESTGQRRHQSCRAQQWAEPPTSA